MATCQFVGNADMYGLGIRLGFYLQWYGAIIASWLARSEVQGLRLTLAFFIAATFLALIIQTIQNNLQTVEIYIILLLTFGSYLSLIPLFAWRLLTGCDPYLDPSRFPIVDSGATSSDLHVLLLLSVVAFQLWYWFARVPELASAGCQEWGFLFAKIALKSVVLQVINIVLNFILGTIVLGLATIRAIKVLNRVDDRDEGKRWRERFTDQELLDRINLLHNLDSLFKLVTTSIVIAAGELTIRWNNVSGVDNISSAGQLIPFVIGVGSVIRIIYVRWRRGPNGDIGSDGEGHVDPFLRPRDPLPFERMPELRISRPRSSGNRTIRGGRIVDVPISRGRRPSVMTEDDVIVIEEDEEIVTERRRVRRPARPQASDWLPSLVGYMPPHVR
jgi:hypothetical protein